MRARRDVGGARIKVDHRRPSRFEGSDDDDFGGRSTTTNSSTSGCVGVPRRRRSTSREAIDEYELVDEWVRGCVSLDDDGRLRGRRLTNTNSSTSGCVGVCPSTTTVDFDVDFDALDASSSSTRRRTKAAKQKNDAFTYATTSAHRIASHRIASHRIARSCDAFHRRERVG